MTGRASKKKATAVTAAVAWIPELPTSKKGNEMPNPTAPGAAETPATRPGTGTAAPVDVPQYEVTFDLTAGTVRTLSVIGTISADEMGEALVEHMEDYGHAPVCVTVDLSAGRATIADDIGTVLGSATITRLDTPQTPARRDSDPTSGPSVATTGGPAPALPELPTCGGPATLRVELFHPTATTTGVVLVCTGDIDAVSLAAFEAGWLPGVWADEQTQGRCGEWIDPTAVPARPVPPPPTLPGTGSEPGETRPALEETPAPAESGQPARVRLARARMLRLISDQCYGVDRPALPAPESVRFLHDSAFDSPAVIIECGTVAEATAWAARLGAAGTVDDRQAIVDGQTVRLYTAWALWQGASVVVSAQVPVRLAGAAA